MTHKATNDKPRKYGKNAIDRAEDVSILAAKIHKITDAPVTVSRPDWAILKRLGKLSMRVPHDENVAYLNKVPVRLAVSS